MTHPTNPEPPTEKVPEGESTRGRLTWFSSEEGSGPDCGLSLGLGDGRTFYIGELARAAIEEHGIDIAKTGDGWWIAMFDEACKCTDIAGSVVDAEAAEAIMDALFAALNHPGGAK